MIVNLPPGNKSNADKSSVNFYKRTSPRDFQGSIFDTVIGQDIVAFGNCSNREACEIRVKNALQVFIFFARFISTSAYGNGILVR